jgi:hypothetical protein
MKRKRIIYFLLCIAAVVLASFKGGPITYSILFGVLLVTPVSLIYLLIVYFFFKLYQVLGTKHITAYEPIPYYFVLQNEYLLNFCHISVSTYSTFSYIDEMQQDNLKDMAKSKPKALHKKTDFTKTYELLPGENVRYDTTMICRYRGDYHVGIKHITIVDFFRLFKITYRVPEPLNAVVLPRVIKLETLKSVPEMVIATYKENPRLSSDFDAQTRDYMPGDPLKGIHWKSTAKTGKLKSRITYGEQRQGISIFLDTKRISDDEYVFIPVENKCLEIVLALTNYFANYSVPTSLVYSQFEPRTAKCSAAYEMESFLNTVSAMKFRSDEEAAVTLDILMAGSVFKDCMIAFLVITGADAELNKRLYELSTFGINIVVYLVGVHPNVQDIMELANVRVIPVYPEDDLAKVL